MRLCSFPSVQPYHALLGRSTVNVSIKIASALSYFCSLTTESAYFFKSCWASWAQRSHFYRFLMLSCIWLQINPCGCGWFHPGRLHENSNNAEPHRSILPRQNWKDYLCINHSMPVLTKRSFWPKIQPLIVMNTDYGTIPFCIFCCTPSAGGHLIWAQ